MKQAEEMIQAIKDWVKKGLEQINLYLEKDFLKKTGDASKVTNVFSTYSTRTLPASGESLDISLGKIRKWLGDLSKAAISGKYEDLLEIPVEKALDVYVEATSAAEEITLMHLEGSMLGDREGEISGATLLYGAGGVSSSTKRGTTDFVRIYLLHVKREDSATGAGAGHTLVQLGSSGQTARWSLTATTTTTSSYLQKLVLKVPKGAWAEVRAMNLPFY